MYKDIDIYYIRQITIKNIGGCENIYSVNPLYLINGKVDGHIEEKNLKKIFSFWFKGVAFCRWKQRSIKKVHRTFGWD